MNKNDFVARLRNDATANNFKVEGDFIVFDKKSNPDYQVLESFKLKELLTKNPAVSLTKLDLNLLVSLDTIRETVGFPLTIRASYASPEYHLTSFGAHDSTLYTTGCALSLGIESAHLENLIRTVREVFKGEVFIYKWGVHIGRTSDTKEIDYRLETGIKPQINNVLTNHTMKNWLLIGAVAVAGYFFFIKK